MDMIEELRALCDKAWQEVTLTKEYRVYARLKDIVKDAGGEETLREAIVKKSAEKISLGSRNSQRLTQVDAALKALGNHGEPLPIGRLLENAIEVGAKVGGSDPLQNFRSALSKDKRIESITRNGMFFWWFTDRELPENWNEAAANDLVSQAAASSNSNQEGGGGHGPATT